MRSNLRSNSPSNENRSYTTSNSKINLDKNQMNFSFPKTVSLSLACNSQIRKIYRDREIRENIRRIPKACTVQSSDYARIPFKFSVHYSLGMQYQIHRYISKRNRTHIAQRAATAALTTEAPPPSEREREKERTLVVALSLNSAL